MSDKHDINIQESLPRVVSKVNARYGTSDDSLIGTKNTIIIARDTKRNAYFAFLRELQESLKGKKGPVFWNEQPVYAIEDEYHTIVADITVKDVPRET